jgi:hypothetical protein
MNKTPISGKWIINQWMNELLHNKSTVSSSLGTLSVLTCTIFQLLDSFLMRSSLSFSSDTLVLGLLTLDADGLFSRFSDDDNTGFTQT